jgi:hypothetical protein
VLIRKASNEVKMKLYSLKNVVEDEGKIALLRRRKPEKKL